MIISTATRERGYFNRYYTEHGLYDQFQPILYVDNDVIFDRAIGDLLIDVLLQSRVCCATETRRLEHLIDCSPRDWPKYHGNFFGRYLYAADPRFPSRAALGNSGVVGFSNIDLVRVVNALVKAIARRQTERRLRNFGDQPIFNYALHKTELGNYQLLNKYVRLTRGLGRVPPTERRGLVHFHLASGAEVASAKLAMMKSYLEILAGAEERT
jgi:hypothetical protein